MPVKLLRFLASGLWLVGTLVLAALDLLQVAIRDGFQPTSEARARWLQRNARRVMQVFVAELITQGVQPRAGLLVANHISYVDILVLGTISPAVFVAKSEVAGWPVFGWFASGCGTIFVRRSIRGDVARISEEIRQRMERGFLVVLFPEGTSSDGTAVLPFKSSLLEPVKRGAGEVFTAHLSYHNRTESAPTQVPYWGEMTLVPHLVKLLGQPRCRARVNLSAVTQIPDCRKELARQLQAEVTRLQSA